MADDAVAMLKQDHKRVQDLFDRYERESDPGSQAAREMTQQMFAELLAHAQIEEDIFYPAVQDADDKAVQMIGEGIEEHHAAEALIDDLMKRGADDSEYAAKMATLISSVRHHIEEEEKELFPIAQKALSGRLDEIGKDMNDLKQDIRRAA
ncbi:MAG: hemerythrin domain-containing protein [Dehalococcoidia bacterium]